MIHPYDIQADRHTIDTRSNLYFIVFIIRRKKRYTIIKIAFKLKI